MQTDIFINPYLKYLVGLSFYLMKFIIKFLNADSKSLEKTEKFFPPIKDYLKNNNSTLTIDLFKNNLESIYLDEKVLQSFAFSKNALLSSG